MTYLQFFMALSALAILTIIGNQLTQVPVDESAVDAGWRAFCRSSPELCPK